MDTIDTLLAECLDGEPDAKTLRRLRALLRRDPARAKQALGLMREGQALGHILSSLDDTPFVEGVMRDIRDETVRFVSRVKRDVHDHALRRRQRLRLWPALAAAASVLITAGALIFRTSPRTPIMADRAWNAISVVGRIVDAQGQTVRAGTVLNPGTVLTAEPDARLALSNASGTRIDMNGGTRLALLDSSRSERLELLEGQVYCQVRKRVDKTAPFAIRAPNGLRIEALGTRFEVRTSSEQTEVLLEAGRLALHGAGQVATVTSLQAVSFKGGRFSAPEPIPPYRIAVWKFDPLPFVDGPILYEDDFEGDLNRWTAVIFTGSKNRGYAIEESRPPETVPEISRLKLSGRNGKTSTALAIRLPFPSKTNILMDYSVQAQTRGYSEEYDVKLGNTGHINHKMYIREKQYRRFPVNPADEAYGKEAARSGEWYRIRKEYRWRLDDQGHECMEYKAYINGRQYSHQWLYPVKLHFGFMVMTGEVLVDNYVLREMVPSDAAGQ